jgi:hypothetical protein
MSMTSTIVNLPELIRKNFGKYSVIKWLQALSLKVSNH